MGKAPLAFLLLSITLISGCGGRRSGVVFFGDSIFGAMDIPTYFPNKPYTNGGMFGYRTDQLGVLLSDVLTGRRVCHGLAGSDTFPLVCNSIPPPATIVILAGWNNFFQAEPSGAFGDIRAIGEVARAKGVRVVLCTLYAYDPAHPAPWMQPNGNAPADFYDMWRVPLNNELKTIPGIDIVDLGSVFSGQSGYTVDGVHPTPAGYAQIRDALVPVLESSQ